MAVVVLDASVIAALYVEEDLTEPAREALLRFGEAGDEVHAPDLLLVECASALWKRVARGELDRESAMAAVGAIGDWEDLERHPTDGGLVSPALSLAMAHQMTAYDALYVALAVQLGGVVVTGDRRLVEVAVRGGLPVRGVWEVGG